MTRATLYQGSSFSAMSWAASIGFRARYNGVNGFVTAGHCVPLYGSVETNVGVGNVLYKQCGGTVDVAFIDVHDGYSVSNMTADGDTISGIICYPAEEKGVYMRGGATGRMLSGTIYATTYTLWSVYDPCDGRYYSLTDQYCISYANGTTTDGDSGGIVYANYNGANHVVGIHIGIGGIHNRPAATKASNILNVTGITPY